MQEEQIPWGDNYLQVHFLLKTRSNINICDGVHLVHTI